MGLLVSVIVPTHQRFAMFVKCIYSLAAQSFPKDEYEVIAVHDGLEHDYNAGEIEHLNGLFRNFSFHQYNDAIGHHFAQATSRKRNSIVAMRFASTVFLQVVRMKIIYAL